MPMPRYACPRCGRSLAVGSKSAGGPIHGQFEERSHFCDCRSVVCGDRPCPTCAAAVEQKKQADCSKQPAPTTTGA